MASAIELYQKAYDLDYRKGDWETAEDLYKKIVADFPHSEEKEYALVHLDRIEKLKSNPDETPLASPHAAAGGGHGLSVFNFLLSLLLLCAVCVVGYLGWQQIRRVDYIDMVLNGLYSQERGQFQEAAVSFKRAQAAQPGEALAFRLMAELRLKQGIARLTEAEVQRWERLFPADPHLKPFKEKLKGKGAK
jgi:outer membrane protein assembly factor BamD (BamD/ComL family)